MRKVLFHKLLKFELLVIIALLVAILVVSVLNGRRHRKFEQSAPAMQPVEPPPTTPESEVFIDDDGQYTEFGLASYYGPEFQGASTASGDVYDRNALTAAHRELPFGTQVRVTNMESGEQVVVRINDRGPHDETRILDVSEQAAKELGIFDAGVTRVRIEALE